MRFHDFLKEEGEAAGGATVGTTTSDIAKTPGQVINPKKKKKKKKDEDN